MSKREASISGYLIKLFEKEMGAGVWGLATEKEESLDSE